MQLNSINANLPLCLLRTYRPTKNKVSAAHSEYNIKVRK